MDILISYDTVSNRPWMKSVFLTYTFSADMPQNILDQDKLLD